MSLIVDASVAVKWYVEEPFSSEAEALLLRDDLAAPALIVAEVANVMWKRLARGDITRDQAQAALSRFAGDVTTICPMAELIAPAFDLAARLKHPVYDCLYLALAQREGAPLVTADRRLAGLAETTGIPATLLG